MSTTASTSGSGTAPHDGKKPFRWGFFSAAGVILLLLVAGQAAGFVLEDFGPRGTGTGGSAGSFLAAMRARDWLFLAFLASTAVFLFLQRGALARFFRAMHVGVTLIALSCIAVAVGVLVPQIDGFEDPTVRMPRVSDVPLDAVREYLAWVGPKEVIEDPRVGKDDAPVIRRLPRDQALRLKGYRAQYDMFKWAEGYFLYHLTHLYGIGMPSVPLPPSVEDSLARFGERYGTEERDNRRKQMLAAFSGMEKTKQIGDFIARHGVALRRAFDTCTALELNRAYKSAWFATLLGLLGIAVGFNSIRFGVRKTLSLQKVGFFTVHVGVMTILAGGLWSKIKSDRGILHMDLREGRKDVYFAYGSPDKPTRMPFALGLERFARTDWPTLEVGFFEDQFKSNLPEYTLWPGREIELDYALDESGRKLPQIRLKVLSLAARARVGDPRFWEAEDRADPKGLGSLAELSVATGAMTDGGGEVDGHTRAHEQTALLKPDYPSRNALYDLRWGFRVRASYGPDPEAARNELLAPVSDVLGALVVRVTTAGDVEPTRIPFRLGQKIEVPGGYTIEVQEAMADFRLDPTSRVEIRDPRPIAEQFPRNPGVWVSITPAAGGAAERRLLLEGLDWEAHGRQDKFTYKDLVLKLEWERWTSKGPPRYVLHWGPDGEALLLGEDGSRAGVEIGKPLALPGGTSVVPFLLLHNALFEKRIDFLAPHVEGPGFDAAFYAQDPAGLEVEVTSFPGTPRETKDVVRMATSDASLANLWSSRDDRFWLRYYGNDKALPFEWRSVLSVWQKDADGKPYKVDLGPEEEREIRVNDYFHYRGYRFFQTNADARFPTYSGIGVVYDPGIPVVLMGMYLTIVGAILAFLIRPIVGSFGRKAREAAA